MTEPKVPATRLVPCPRCRKSTRYDATNEFRPFCSARCKDEDIIGWAEGEFRVAGEPVDPESLPIPPPQKGDED